MRGKANILQGLQMVIWRNDRPLFILVRGEKRDENIAAIALKIENLTGSIFLYFFGKRGSFTSSTLAEDFT